VTHLRKIMLEELQRRHYSEGTTHYYIRHVDRFARHFNCFPDRLGPQHIRQYQAYLFTKRKLSPGSVTNHLCALYIQTLKRAWSIANTTDADPQVSSRIWLCVAVAALGMAVVSMHFPLNEDRSLESLYADCRFVDAIRLPETLTVKTFPRRKPIRNRAKLRSMRIKQRISERTDPP
jgi:hypothetical protein